MKLRTRPTPLRARTRTAPPRDRRGVTLVEMLISVALLVLMMTIIVQVFVAATGAVSAQRVYQELDTELRQVDAMIRQDLGNVTARFTPPLDPKNNLGYFEYIENSFADNQGEDADDCLRFTVKAPEGQTFTGRMYVQSPLAANFGSLSTAQQAAYYQSQPITITSQYAEVIYFLRNGNLYRRVLLVAPERQSAVQQVKTFGTTPFLVPTSWQGMNDLSARSAANMTSASIEWIILNTLGDLTNRENRYASPRFVNDFTETGAPSSPKPGNVPDGEPDDENGDTVPDFWPSLYFNVPSVLLNEPVTAPRWYASANNMAFPYIYPYAYSRPDSETAVYGWIHSPNPNLTSTAAKGWLNVLNALNHNPLGSGDSLPKPTPLTAGGTDVETYWGFPTWRETMNYLWTDPYQQVAVLGQSKGLNPLDPSIQPLTGNANFLPPMTADYIPGTNTQIRLTPQLYNDRFGGNSSFITMPTPLAADALWKQLWEDDLVMTGVRSFDVKAYDNAFAGYVDLGWGDDLRLQAPYVTAATLAKSVPQFLGPISGANPAAKGIPLTLNWPPLSSQSWNLYQETYAHEGRIPPITWDLKFDAQTNGPNVGDDSTKTVRLRRVWDSWSTDYTNAPANGTNPTTGQPLGPPFGPAIYPSYPPPYPMPLRGIQIQIRVVDPRNEKTKVLTIRQDFSDKLK